IKAGKSFAKMTDEQRHALRIDAKKMRYVAECFMSIYPKSPTKKFVKALANLQDELGRLNDGVVAYSLVNSLIDEASKTVQRDLTYAGGIVIGWHRQVATDRRDAQLGIWKSFCKTAP